MSAGKATTKFLLLSNILVALSTMPLAAQPASNAGGNIPPDAVSHANAFILPVNGEALLFNDAAGVSGAKFLPNVYKSFGLSSDSRFFLYLKANGRFPTFSLFCYDVSTKTETKISNNAVHHAVWAPSGHELAYMWLDAATALHVSIYDLATGNTTEVGSGRLRPNFLEWSPNRSELLYVSVTPLTANGIEYSQLSYTLHRYNVRQRTETTVADVGWAQFAGQQLIVLGNKFVSGHQNIQRPNREDVRRFFVSSGQIYGSVIEHGRSVFKRWNTVSGAFEAVGRGDVFMSNARGIVLREYTHSGTIFHFLPKDALQTRPLASSGGTAQSGVAVMQTSALRTATDDFSKSLRREINTPQAATNPVWKMPFAGSAYVVQGGQSYGNGSCDGTQCFITAHQGLLEYSLDWQQRPEEGQGNAHAIAIADGTVVGTLNTVNCNRINPSCVVGWDDYSSTCQDPTSGIGNYVSIAHLDGTYSFYAHLRSASVQVAVNQNVLQGTYLGDQGHSGAAGTYNNYLNCGDHLHFSRQVGPAPWEQSVATDFSELPCLLGCPAAYPSANIEIAAAPVITSITPATFFAGVNPQITISGNNFVYGSTVNISNPAITVSGVLLASGTKITAMLSIPQGTTPGSYTITVTTPNGISNAFPFTVLPNAAGGALTGAVTTPVGSYNLTALGSADWVHWGLSSATSVNRKAGVTPQISNITMVGSGSVGNYANDPIGFSWTGGTPSASATNTTTGVYIYGQNNGFRLTVPADTTPRTLTIYFGVWAARGRMVAHLSDGSAADYVDTSLNNVGGIARGQYSLNYRAAVSGQTLTITYTVDQSHSGDWGNVSLQAATLVEGPFSVSATPATQSVAAGASTNYTVDVSAAAGFSGTVTLAVSGLPAGVTGTFTPASVSSNGSSTLAITTGSGTAPATYPLTITGTSGGVSRTTNVTLVVTAAPGSGALTGAVTTPVGSYNLTALGSADWVHWGLSSATSVNRKAGVTPQISNIMMVGSGSVGNYANDPIGFSWTGGTPSASATNTTTGVYIYGQNNGFRLTVPADTTPRTLTIYFGVWAARGRMVAHLSDGSAADYVDTSLNNVGGIARGQYSLNYRAAVSGQTLTITYTVDQSHSGNWGNVSLQAATLVEGPFSVSATPASQSVAAGASTNYTVDVSAAAGFSGTVTLAVSGLPAGVTGAFTPASVSSSGSSTLAITTGSGTAPATYPLTITGTSGGVSRTTNVGLVVTAAPGSGALTGAVTTPASSYNLTALGSADWVHWGLSSATSVNRKAGMTPQISNIMMVGSGSVGNYANDPIGFSWTGGTPSASATNTTTGVYIYGQDNGFRLTVPADTTPRTLTIYFGVWAARGRMVAHLSDGSAADYVDTSLNNVGGIARGQYSLNYRAAVSGQTLTITYTVDQSHSGDWGNVSLQAATLQ